eukprot:TRINITY_DN6512_c0_g1_i7.p1 TRINITY_DN6512_c0_g1~~TRINITY_DN6512_c0_g1_i7.p1  ORF type:complete len:347 (-),score=45.48 TRINITY_DN6512_c0_g1_i7:150-1190(-)
MNWPQQQTFSIYYSDQFSLIEPKLKELELQLQKTEKALASSEAEFSLKQQKYLSDHQSLEYRVQELVKSMMDYEGINKELRFQLQVLDIEQQRLQQQIISLEQQLSQTKEAETNAKRNSMSLELEYKTVSDAKRAVQQDLQQLKGAITQLYGALGSEVSIEQVRPDVVKALTPRLIALVKQATDMEEVVQERLNNIKVIEKELENALLTQRQYKETIESYEYQHNELLGRLKISEERTLELQNTIATEDQKKYTYENERQSLEQQISTQVEEIERVKIEVLQLQETCDSQKKILALMRGFASEITSEYNDLVHKVEEQPVVYTRTVTAITEENKEIKQINQQQLER